jgi:hypothetical protein
MDRAVIIDVRDGIAIDRRGIHAAHPLCVVERESSGIERSEKALNTMSTTSPSTMFKREHRRARSPCGLFAVYGHVSCQDNGL